METIKNSRELCKAAIYTSLAAILLGGCSTIRSLGPDATVTSVEEEIVVPAEWTENGPSELPIIDWVGSFQDSQLSELVAEGVENNPGALRSLAQFDASLASLRISRADLYPNLSLGVNANRTGTINQSPVDVIDGQQVFVANNNRTVTSARLNTGWEVDLFGRVRDGIDGSLQTAGASASDLAAIRLSVASRVSQTWFDVIEAERLIDLSDRDIERLARSLRLTERRFDSGLSESSDVRLARSALANAEALKATRLQNLNVQMRALEILIGRYPAASLDVPAALPDLPELSGVARPEFVINHRPDILAVEHRIAAAGYSVDVARKSLYPSLNLSASLTEQGLDLGEVIDFQDILSNIIANLTAPIYQGGQIRANIAQQEANLEAQVQNYVETVLQAYQEVENALDAEVRLAEREAALRVSLDEALKAEERLEVRYVEGLATILQLLDAQSRSLNAEGQLISSRAERLQNRVRLHVALGGGMYGEVPIEAQTVLQSYVKDES